MSHIEYRAVIKFLMLEGQTPSEIKTRMNNVFRTDAPSYSMVKDWARSVKCGRKSIEDEPRSGRPPIVTLPEQTELVEEALMTDRQLKAKEISARVGLSKLTALRIIHEHLHMN